MFSNSIDNETVHKGLYNRNCPKCGGSLKVITEGKSVSTTGNAVDSELITISDMKAYITKFACPLCRLKYTYQDLRRIEKQNNNKNR